MVRVQIQLSASQHRQAKRRAKQMGVSVAEVVRRCLNAELQSAAGDSPEDRVRRALGAAGRHADPEGAGGRVAEHHDAALAEAYRQ